MASMFRILCINLLLLCGADLYAGTPALPPAALDRLREDMQNADDAMQRLASAIAAADWATITQQAARLRYRDPAQDHHISLPMRWRKLDEDYRARIDRLSSAAKAKDPVLLIYQYSRLLEGCTSCHAEFAGDTFTGFSGTGHQH